MAVGDYVLDKQEPPPILRKALNYKEWGIGDVMQLPAGLLPKLNVALNYYHALEGYMSAAGQTAAWSNNNPRAWELVSYVIEERMNRKHGNRNK